MDLIEVLPTGFKIHESLFPLIEELFGEQTPIAREHDSIIVDQIRTSRFFRAVVLGGSLKPLSINVKVDDEKESWYADAPDIREYLGSGLSSPIREFLISIIADTAPIVVERYTVLKRRGRICGAVYEAGTIVPCVASEKLSFSQIVEGWVIMRIVPKKVV